MAKKQSVDETQEVVSEEELGEPRVYELGFHIDPDLSQEELKEVYKGMTDAISAEGTIIASGKYEKVTLAYTISRMEHEGRHDFSTAFFAWIAYETTAEGHEKVLEAVNTDKRIFRFIDIVTTKEEALHAEEQRELRMNTSKKVDVVSDEKQEEKSIDKKEEAAEVTA